jgi:hypothetical protein
MKIITWRHRHNGWRKNKIIRRRPDPQKISPFPFLTNCWLCQECCVFTTNRHIRCENISFTSSSHRICGDDVKFCSCHESRILGFHLPLCCRAKGKCATWYLWKWIWETYFIDILRAGRSGDRIPIGVRFSTLVQTGPGAHPTSCTMGTYLSWG